MRTICLYFQVHQPFRLRRYRFFDIGTEHYYYDDYSNNAIMRKIAHKCYLPANQILYDLIQKYGSKFKISYSISGTALEQFEMYAPDVLDSFQKLASTGCVEFLAETYSHSLSSLISNDEFNEQVRIHSEKIEKLFGQKPTVFRNTELIYSDLIGETVANMGFKAMLTEGAKHILGWKSPNYLYYNSINPKLKLLLKNFKLSDDIAFRFSNRAWDEWPLTTDKYMTWLNNIDKKEETINLFMDYETFGEHQWAESGIFEFLKSFPEAVLAKTNLVFATPSEVADAHQTVSGMNVTYPISWADEERDTTAWLGNELQKEAFRKLYDLAPLIHKIDDPQIQRDWKYLQTSDHFYYMCTKFFSDATVHKYFSPYNTPYDAFMNYMNILSDFTQRVNSYEVHFQKQIADEQMTTEQILARIEELEIELERLKNKLLPNVIEITKPTPKAAISKTKKEALAIEKTKPEKKAISKTKKEPLAIEKTKKEPLALEESKEEVKKTKTKVVKKKVEKEGEKEKPEVKKDAKATKDTKVKAETKTVKKPEPKKKITEKKKK